MTSGKDCKRSLMVIEGNSEEPEDQQMEYRYKTGASGSAKASDEESINKFMKEVEENPKNASAHNNLGVALFNLGRHDESVKAFNDAISLNPNEATYYYNRGLAYYNLSMTNEALADFTRAIRITPGEANYHYNKAILLHDIGILFHPLLNWWNIYIVSFTLRLQDHTLWAEEI